MMGQLNEQKPLWFLLEAAGPDKHHHTMWQVLNGTSSNTDEKIALRSKTIYDPTNGSTSRGSIWEVGGTPQGTGSTFATAVTNANSSHVSGWQGYGSY
jgi:hypothetical protein